MIKSFVATVIESSITAMIESLEKGGSFSQRDREKFMQTARTLGIEDSVIEEMIDIYQTLHLSNASFIKRFILPISMKI